MFRMIDDASTEKYSPQEVMQYVQEEDVKFIRLTFCDVFGRPKNISIMPSELQRAFAHGVTVDASALSGFGCEVQSDLFLYPDPSTLSVLPWRPEHGRVVRMFCTVRYADGSLFANDTRGILLRAIDDAQKAGYSFSFGTEMEFYLFRRDEEGNATTVPQDEAGYLDMAPDDKGENVRREICLTLERMGVLPQSSHHEEGPGQNEIDFRYADALTAADNVITFFTVVQTIAARNGLCADFSPKPIADKPGNGMHINMSIRGSAVNRSVKERMVAGILSHAADTAAFLNPAPMSYVRLSAAGAPKYIAWSAENRRWQIVRVSPVYDDDKRVVLRSPDAMLNPYLAFALLIWAGLEGIKKDLPLPQAADGDLSAEASATAARYDRLPDSREKAVTLAVNSAFIRAHLPAALIDEYCRL